MTKEKRLQNRIYSFFNKQSYAKKVVIILTSVLILLYLSIVIYNLSLPQTCIDDVSKEFIRCDFKEKLYMSFIEWPEEMFFFHGYSYFIMPGVSINFLLEDIYVYFFLIQILEKLQDN